MRSIDAVTSLGMKVIGCSIHLIPTNWEINLMVECNPYMVNAKFRLLHLLLKIKWERSSAGKKRYSVKVMVVSSNLTVPALKRNTF